MNTTATEYAAAMRPLTDVVEAVPGPRWADPSPCEGWTALDVLRHLVDTQREFLTGRGVALGPVPDLRADPAAGWRSHAERVAEVLTDGSVVTEAYDGHFGPTTLGATLEQFYVWDMLVHRWDIARAVNAPAQHTDAELDRISAGADSFGDALYMEGICRPGAEPPAEVDRQTRVLARLGRSS